MFADNIGPAEAAYGTGLCGGSTTGEI